MANKQIHEYKDLAVAARDDLVLSEVADETTYNAPTFAEVLALIEVGDLPSHAASHQSGGADAVALDASQIASGALAAARQPVGTLKTDAPISSTAQYIKDKDGNASALALSNDNVGIGTTSPSYKLEVRAGDTAGIAVFDSEASTGEVRLGSVWNRKGVYSNTDLNILGTSGLALSGRGNTTDLYIDTSGNTYVKTVAQYKFTTVHNRYEDYRRAVILLHEIYNGTLLADNYASGKIFASRGGVSAGNRKNIAEVNTGSAYMDTTNGKITSISSEGIKWKLVTCTYNGVKYMAIEVPYGDANLHTFTFEGYHQSSGADGLRLVNYYDTSSGTILNSEIYNSLADFTSYGQEYVDASTFAVSGNVGIGTTDPGAKLHVNGAIRCVLPTSSSGLSSGDLWNDNGTVKIVT